MQTVDINLKQNPEIADLVASLDPGAKIMLHTSLKSKDDQTATLTIESAEEGEIAESDAESDTDDTDESAIGLPPDSE